MRCATVIGGIAFHPHAVVVDIAPAGMSMKSVRMEGIGPYARHGALVAGAGIGVIVHRHSTEALGDIVFAVTRPGKAYRPPGRPVVDGGAITWEINAGFGVAITIGKGIG